MHYDPAMPSKFTDWAKTCEGCQRPTDVVMRPGGKIPMRGRYVIGGRQVDLCHSCEVRFRRNGKLERQSPAGAKMVLDPKIETRIRRMLPYLSVPAIARALRCTEWSVRKVKKSVEAQKCAS
jgi:hypothetical protein